MKSTSAPDAGDLVWLTFDPQAGHEQAGRGPALIMTPRSYNLKSGLALVCPITSQVKGHPFEVPLSTTESVTGVVLVDRMKSVDWKARKASTAGRCRDSVMEEVRAKLAALLRI